MTTDEIKQLNESGYYNEWEQGIFVQPNHIPVSIKEPVVYMRWNSHGRTGGSCWNDNPSYPYTNDVPNFEALTAVCIYLYPEITGQQLVMINSLVTEDDGGYDLEYYGNGTDYTVKYILLSKVEELIEQFKK